MLIVLLVGQHGHIFQRMDIVSFRIRHHAGSHLYHDDVTMKRYI